MRYTCYLCHGKGEKIDLHDHDKEMDVGPCPECVGKGRPPVLHFAEESAKAIIDAPAPAVQNTGNNEKLPCEIGEREDVL
jgi:NAD-dependent SIR2 family protein deacetylase